MAKVIGLGGVFMLSKDPQAVQDWYFKHLGVKFEPWGTTFQMDEVKASSPGAYNVMSFFKEGSDYVKPSTAGFMINLIVDDLDALIEKLKSEGVETHGYQAGEYGKFSWVLDPNGVKVELWEPVG
jgi:predicted enzyme related to lactoylglutathione lyase